MKKTLFVLLFVLLSHNANAAACDPPVTNTVTSCGLECYPPVAPGLAPEWVNLPAQPTEATCGYPEPYTTPIVRDCTIKSCSQDYHQPYCPVNRSLQAKGVFEYSDSGENVHPRLCGPGRLLTQYIEEVSTCWSPGYAPPISGEVNIFKINLRWGLLDSGYCCVGGPPCGCSS